MPRLVSWFHCERCDEPYLSLKEAEACEAQPDIPAAFSVGDTIMSFYIGHQVTIVGCSFEKRTHRPLYRVKGPKRELHNIKEDWLHLRVKKCSPAS